MSLKDLLDQQANLEQKLIDAYGEITPELEAELCQLELKLPEKIDRYCGFLDKIQSEAQRLSDKAKRFGDAARALETLQEKLVLNVKNQMIANNIKELCGLDERFVLSKSRPKVVVENAALLPEQLVDTQILVKPNKEKIKEYLDLGNTVNGVRLEESFAIRRYINKGIKNG